MALQCLDTTPLECETTIEEEDAATVIAMWKTNLLSTTANKATTAKYIEQQTDMTIDGLCRTVYTPAQGGKCMLLRDKATGVVAFCGIRYNYRHENYLFERLVVLPAFRRCGLATFISKALITDWKSDWESGGPPGRKLPVPTELEASVDVLNIAGKKVLSAAGFKFEATHTIAPHIEVWKHRM